MNTLILPSRRKGVRDKLAEINWGYVLILTMIAGIGVAALYSVAEGWRPWALNHAMRFGVAFLVLIGVALINLRFWMTIAYPAYAVILVMLMLIPFIGEVNMGAQRWLQIGPIQVQPSEFMKIALILALARYYHGLRVDQVSHPLYMIPPLLMIAIPVALVAEQPDLGTSLMIFASGAVIVFLAGLSWRIVGAGVVGGVVAVWAALKFHILEDYQVERIMTFLNPERDPLGQGYHLLQSKIALGSGGVSGKGFMQGTQSHLNFLPEMHTDFIFTIFGEEFGLVGAGVLLLLYLAVFLMGVNIAMRAKSHFGRLIALGISVTSALYVLINTGMVMGLAPVVGVPLPLVSYGGTVMLTIMAGFGLVLSAHVHREQDTLRSGDLL
ncbi:MAG: rod shape-determining protein RodA [Pseudomonadota bacterium]